MIKPKKPQDVQPKAYKLNPKMFNLNPKPLSLETLDSLDPFPSRGWVRVRDSSGLHDLN